MIHSLLRQCRYLIYYASAEAWMITTKWLQDGKKRNAECAQLKGQLEKKLKAFRQQQVLLQKHRMTLSCTKFFLVTIKSRGVDPYGTGGTCPPNIYEGDVHGNVPPQYFRSDVL